MKLSRKRVYILVVSVLLAIVVSILNSSGSLNRQVILALITGLLISYNISEALYLKEGTSKYWLANPVFLASVYLFIVMFGITNLGYYVYSGFGGPAMPDAIFSEDQSEWLFRAVQAAFVSSVGMWQGYHSKVSRFISEKAKRSDFLRGIMKAEGEPRWWLVWASFIAGLLSSALLFSIGGFGYHSYGTSITLPYQFYLGLTSSLSYIAIIFVSYRVAEKPSPWVRWLLFVILAVMVLRGLVSGMKHQAVYPVVISGITYYTCGRKISYTLLFSSLLVLLVAYVSVSSLRVTYNMQGGSTGISFQESIQSVYSVYRSEDIEINFVERLSGRLHITSQAGWAMMYGSSPRESPQDPNFRYRLSILPVYTFIPRLLWPSKPEANVGGWAYSRATGYQGNSMAISPVAPLYLAGGLLLCFVGFFVVGVFQRLSFTFLETYGLAGLIVFLIVLEPITRMESQYYPVIVKFIRYLPIAILAQCLLLKNK